MKLDYNHNLDCEPFRIEATIQSLVSIRSDDAFNVVYNAAVEFATGLKLEQPRLPIRQTAGRPPSRPKSTTAKERLKDIYFEILDAVIRGIKFRLSDGSLDLLKKIVKVIKGVGDDDDLEIISSTGFYSKEANKESASTSALFRTN